MIHRCYRCGRLIDVPMLPVQVCPNCAATVRNIIKYGDPAEFPRHLLREEYPGLEDAELGLEPEFGYDPDGTPIY